ncbi:hypothetical protein CSC67_05745 [Pusillimonas caeni]|uniref:hypothetical protein n=1 Tax=Pusillimonas caeni TaxID=1348472 RepID=UPI000E59D621|nr:hypothetical protein [Pusillimonas caeni]TFL14847.1 hypothetical protein CSC67_05745 [Pusillimonas caeni]
MFNITSRVQLREFHSLVEIRRDCAFFTCGKIPTRAPAKLVPISSEKYLRELIGAIDSIAGVICTPELYERIPQNLGCAVAKNPSEAISNIHSLLCARDNYYWTNFSSKIAPSARIHPTAYVSSEDVIIEEDVVIGPNASILSKTIIGKGSQIGSNTTLGSDAYEISVINGRPQLLSQAGGVRIGTGVIFLSGCAVARSSFPLFTEIGDYCSFDNLVHVAHDCVLGRGVKMTACSMLSGRVTLENGVFTGPNSTISNGLTMGENSFVTIGSVVVSDVNPNNKVSGNFAVDHRLFKKHFVKLSR